MLLDLIRVAGYSPMLIRSSPASGLLVAEILGTALPRREVGEALRQLQTTLWRHLADRPALRDERVRSRAQRLLGRCFAALWAASHS